MGILHELLAVEGDLKARAQEAAARLKSLFQNGQGNFLGQTIVYKPLEELGEQFPPQVTHVATTVDEELAIIGQHYENWIDAALQKEQTNQKTRATLVIGGATVDLSATSLLNLEAKLLELRSMYKDIPTNDVTIPWRWDDATENFVSESPETRHRTKKVIRSHVAYEATDKHPAQVETYNEDMIVGFLTTTKQSGMITPADKRARMEKINSLLQAVKQARQRANNIEVQPINVGGIILAHINGE